MKGDIIAILADYIGYNMLYRLGLAPIIITITMKNDNNRYILFRDKYIYYHYIDYDSDYNYNGCGIYKSDINYKNDIYSKCIRTKYSTKSISYNIPGLKLEYVDGSMSFMNNYYYFELKIADNINIIYNIYERNVEFEYKVKYDNCTDIHIRNYTKNTPLFRILSGIRDKIYQRLTA